VARDVYADRDGMCAWDAQEEINMHTLLQLVVGISAIVLVACLVDLHWRMAQDGALLRDMLLVLTGLPTIFYIRSRWDRARGPVLGIVGASAVLVTVMSISNRLGAAPYQPTSEELAAEVKPLILQEWKETPGLEQTTIQSISLVPKGEGRYSGSIEAMIDGQASRLALEVVLDRETIRWKINAGAN
jgi:hypothetical protein